MDYYDFLVNLRTAILGIIENVPQPQDRVHVCNNLKILLTEIELQSLHSMKEDV